MDVQPIDRTKPTEFLSNAAGMIPDMLQLQTSGSAIKTVERIQSMNPRLYIESATITEEVATIPTSLPFTAEAATMTGGTQEALQISASRLLFRTMAIQRLTDELHRRVMIRALLPLARG